MLDERTLSGMDRDQLLRYVAVLHQALSHVMGAAGEAQAFVERNAPDARRSPSRDPMQELANALGGGARRT